MLTASDALNPKLFKIIPQKWGGGVQNDSDIEINIQYATVLIRTIHNDLKICNDNE